MNAKQRRIEARKSSSITPVGTTVTTPRGTVARVVGFSRKSNARGIIVKFRNNRTQTFHRQGVTPA